MSENKAIVDVSGGFTIFCSSVAGLLSLGGLIYYIVILAMSATAIPTLGKAALVMSIIVGITWLLLCFMGCLGGCPCLSTNVRHIIMIIYVLILFLFPLLMLPTSTLHAVNNWNTVSNMTFNASGTAIPYNNPMSLGVFIGSTIGGSIVGLCCFACCCCIAPISLCQALGKKKKLEAVATGENYQPMGVRE